MTGDQGLLDPGSHRAAAVNTGAMAAHVAAAADQLLAERGGDGEPGDHLGGHSDEFAPHVRAARSNGLTDAEIGEVILHGAVHCGVPAANHGFGVAQRVLGGDGRD